MTHKTPAALALIALAIASATVSRADAACVSLSSSSAYSQNFDSLANSGSSTTNDPPSGWAILETGTSARVNQQYAIDNGGSTTGDTYSYGSTGSSDRALGTLLSGTITPVFGACFTNNTGSTIQSVAISYNGEEWRLGTASRTDQLVFEYSASATSLSTGTWTGVSALNFTTPATTTTGAKDGNAAANRTALSSSISGLNLANGATVWIRWRDTDASGSDDGLAVDDFSLTPTLAGGGSSTSPSLTVSASVNPVTAGNSTTLTASNTAGTSPTSSTFTDTCNLSGIGGSATASLPAAYTVPSNTTPTTYSISCSVTDDQSRTGSYTLSLTVSAPPPAAKKIYEITGSGTTSPLAGTQVTTSGVVTAVRATTGNAKGFFIQSISGDRDSDANTSEGLLVFIGSASLPSCAVVGNQIQIQGTVSDFVQSTAPTGSVPLTELASTSNCTVLSTPGVSSLPSAVTLTSSSLDPNGSATQARKYLGMRVTMSNTVVVGPSTGTVTEANATSTVGFNFFITASGVSRPFHSQAGILATRRPSDAASTVPSWNGNPEVLEVDSTSFGGTNIAVATGTTISSIAGVVDYDTAAGQFELACNSADIGTLSPTSPTLSATPIAAPLTTDLLVVDANIERFYDTNTDSNGVTLTSTAYQGRLSKLSLAVRNVMRMPDIIAIEEAEGPAASVSSPTFPVLQDIVNKINSDAASASQGSPNYGYCGGVTNDPSMIAPAVIYRQDRVTQLECSQYGISTTYTLPYTTTPTTNTLNDRPPVVFRGRAKAAGSDSSLDVRIVVNHLRSLNGIDEPGTANGDRVRTKRNEQAKYLGKLVSGNLGSEQNVNWTQTDNLIVAGDMNAFDINDGFSDSVNCIAGSPAAASQIYATQAQLNASSPCTAISGLSLTNLTTTDTAQRYSYSFNGIAQRIDHVLVNAT